MGNCKSFLVIFLTVIIAICANFLFYRIELPQECYLDTVSRIERFGFKGEEHIVTTIDGYDLKLHRIVPKQKNNKKPILILPGYTLVSDSYILAGPKKDLSFILADAQFDVWIANFRSTFNGLPNPKSNITLQQHKSFGYHEIALYDVPAILDYVVKATNEESVTVIGSCFGGTELMIALSELPQYNRLVDKAVLFPPLVPCVDTILIQKIIGSIVNGPQPIHDLFDKFQEHVMMHEKNRRIVVSYMCSNPLTKWTCVMIKNIFGHNDPRFQDEGNLALAALYIPGGYLLNGYKQYHASSFQEKFSKPDLGEIKNLEIYGQKTAPEYDTSSFIVPVKAYYIEEDSVISARCTLNALSYIPNLKSVFLIKKPFDHANAIMNSGSSPEFINDILKYLLE